MIKGLYTAASGMMVQLAKQDVVANNIANSNTNGYKRQLAVTSSFPQMLISRMEGNPSGNHITNNVESVGGLGTGVGLAGIYTDFSMGSLLGTGNNEDFAIGNDGYFVVETPQGDRYTRSGSFKVNFDGLLTTKQGFPVLDDQDEYIFVEPGYAIDRQGAITQQGEEIARLKVVTFDDAQSLSKVGENLYAGTDPIIAEEPDIRQGYLEQSNVNAVQEMVILLGAVRGYETLQKVVQAEDELNQSAIDKVGSLE